MLFFIGSFERYVSSTYWVPVFEPMYIFTNVRKYFQLILSVRETRMRTGVVLGISFCNDRYQITKNRKPEKIKKNIFLRVLVWVLWLLDGGIQQTDIWKRSKNVSNNRIQRFWNHKTLQLSNQELTYTAYGPFGGRTRPALSRLVIVFITHNYYDCNFYFYF